MQETMGKIIKRLRKERGFTQEELAEQLGVTFQAVSKWENDLGMPDISQVIPLSTVFNVRTDVLFGYSGTNNAEEVNKLIINAQALIDHPVTKQGLHRCYDALLKGLEKYPNNSGLLMQCLETGVSLAYPENDHYDAENGESIYTECIREADIVIKYSKNATDILRAHMIMVLLHSSYGNMRSAKAHAAQFPWRTDMTAHEMNAYIAHFEKNYQAEGKYLQTNILYHFEAILDDIAMLGRCYCLLGNHNDAEYSLKQGLSLINLLCKDEDIIPHFHDREMGDLYSLLAEVYLKTDRTDDALKTLAEMVDHDINEYKKYSTKRKMNSPLLRDADYDFYTSDIGEKLHLKLKPFAFSKLKNEDAFIKLLSKANSIYGLSAHHNI